MTRAPAGKARQNLSLAPHVRAALHAQAEAAGLDVSAYVTSLVMREETNRDVERRMRNGVPRHLAEGLEQGKENRR